MESRIELAKSKFELSKILISIAGFCVIAAGIFLSALMMAFSISVQKEQEIMNIALNHYSNLTAGYLQSSVSFVSSLTDLAESYIHLPFILLGLALVLSIFSIILWYWGRKELKN